MVMVMLVRGASMYSSARVESSSTCTSARGNRCRSGRMVTHVEDISRMRHSLLDTLGHHQTSFDGSKEDDQLHRGVSLADWKLH
jgi:hypothetical protein